MSHIDYLNQLLIARENHNGLLTHQAERIDLISKTGKILSITFWVMLSFCVKTSWAKPDM